jgi:hypothetical protein
MCSPFRSERSEEDSKSVQCYKHLAPLGRSNKSFRVRGPVGASWELRSMNIGSYWILLVETERIYLVFSFSRSFS